MATITYFIGLILASLLIASLISIAYYWPKCLAQAADD